MPVPFIMPKFDMDQESARIVEWFKGEGDFVELDEIVLVVETDKVAVDVPAPASGTLARISAGEGADIPVAEIIAYILEKGESEFDLPSPEKSGRPAKAPALTPSGLSSSTSATRDPETSQPASARIITPLAKRIAREFEVDLNLVPASGGRITKKDIEVYLTSNLGQVGRVKTAATPAARRLSREMGINLEAISGTGPGGRVQAADLAQEAELISPLKKAPVRPAERVALTGMRRTIAERMQTSFQTAPHIGLTIEADVTELEKYQGQINQQRAGEEGEKISLTALIIMVLGQTLARHPYLNASLIDEEIYLWKEINIGVATAVDEGLIVPVIARADQLPVAEINRQLKDLSSRARRGRLGLNDVRGGTFTLSNLGMFGIQSFQAIINPPESAILAIGRVVRRPVVVDDQDHIAVRPVMNLTLSADHRIVDGVGAALFLTDLVAALENPIEAEE